MPFRMTGGNWWSKWGWNCEGSKDIHSDTLGCSGSEMIWNVWASNTLQLSICYKGRHSTFTSQGTKSEGNWP